MQKPFKPKPEWLRKKILLSSLKEVESLLDQAKVHTVCQEAMCPNIAECFTQRVATFMLLGTHCTRACTFCAVSKGKPTIPERDEPMKVAETIKQLGLRHVVITSVTRDDLSDGGAAHFCRTVHAIKAVNMSVNVELLIPDLHENEVALKQIALSGAEIIGHNLETVSRLYHIRRGAEYDRSLRLLEKLHLFNPSIVTKSGIMLGLGESDDEIVDLMKDLLAVGCRLLSIGQYLSPSPVHTEVVEYIKPQRFNHLRDIGMEMGFNYIKSSPYTRSSYMAHEYLEQAYLNKEVV